MAKTSGKKDIEEIQNVGEDAKDVEPVEEMALKGKDVTITSFNTEDEVVHWDRQGANLLFDDQQFLQLDDRVVSQLGYYNKRSYFLAEAAIEQRRKFEESGGVRGGPKIEVFNPLDGGAGKKITIKDQDKGSHVTFVRPDQEASFKEAGYTNVSDPKRVPGTRMDANGKLVVKDRAADKVDLIPMETSIENHERISGAPGKLSRARLRKTKDDYKDFVLEKGRRASGRQIVRPTENGEVMEG